MSRQATDRAVEWKTVGLLVAFFVSWAVVLGEHRHLPWFAELVVLTCLGGLWMSLGHELLHGHPTRWNAVNTAIGSLPLTLWLPFSRYKATHIQHHHCDLTDPFDDPESSYTDVASWAAAGRLRRGYLTFLRTAVGRFTIGVPRTVDLAKSEEDRRVMELIYSQQDFGRPFLMAPETPPDRLAALRRAFMQALGDKDLLAEAERLKLDVNPVSGEEIQKIVLDAHRTPAAIVRRTGELLKGPN